MIFLHNTSLVELLGSISVNDSSKDWSPLAFALNTPFLTKPANLSESEFYTRNTKATSLIVLTKEDLFDNNLESTDETFKAILKDQEFEMTLKNKISNKDIENMVNDGSIGTIFYPLEEGISKSKIKSLINISNKTKTPVLFSKST